MNQFLGKSVPLSEAGFSQACHGLGGNACSLWALLTVETRGYGFLPDGRPKILFERHVFHRLTDGRYDAGHSGISSSSPGGYLGGAREYERLAEAVRLDPEAGLQSASWGLGQIMGFHAKGLGYASADAMVARFADGEDYQLDGVRRFIQGHKELNAAFHAREWSTVARWYNGPDFARNEWDSKLRYHFEHYAANGTPSIEVRTAQAQLTILKFDPKGVDGIFGPATRRAVGEFQKAKGIPVSSQLDSRTLDELAAAGRLVASPSR